MYFWNVNALVGEIAAGQVTERQKLKYLIASQFILTLAMVETADPGNFETSIVLIFFEICFLLYFLSECFDINESVDDSDFISRVTMIGFPLFFRLLVLVIPVVIIEIIISANEIMSTIFMIVLSFVYWLWMKSAFSTLADLKNNAQKPEEQKGTFS